MHRHLKAGCTLQRCPHLPRAEQATELNSAANAARFATAAAAGGGAGTTGAGELSGRAAGQGSPTSRALGGGGGAGASGGNGSGVFDNLPARDSEGDNSGDFNKPRDSELFDETCSEITLTSAGLGLRDSADNGAPGSAGGGGGGGGGGGATGNRERTTSSSNGDSGDRASVNESVCSSASSLPSLKNVSFVFQL